MIIVRIKYGLTIMISILFVINLNAQNGSSFSYPDARSVAMGSPFAVTSLGVYSVNSNPANLAITKSNIEISTVLPIPNFSGSTGSDFMSISDYNYYFGGVQDESGFPISRFLSSDDKQNLLSKFDSGNEVRTSGIINLLAVSVSPGKDIGSFAFSINDVAGQKFALPKDLVELSLFGNEVGKEYNFEGFRLSSSYLREYDLSYARDFSNLLDDVFTQFSAGITLKYINGYAYSEIEKMDTKIVTNDDYSIHVMNNMKANFAVSQDLGVNWDFDNRERNSSFGVFPDPVGTGWGLNIGFAAKLEDTWTFGLSLTDIGSVHWNRETVSYTANGDLLITDITDSELLDTLASAVEPTGSYSNGFYSNLPTVLRMGATLRLDKIIEGNFPGEMLLAFGYNQGFNNGVNNTTFPLLSIGFEWKPIEVIPIRSGIAVGGIDGIAWSFGFGIDARIVEFNLATSNMTTVFRGNDSKIIHIVFGSKWKF